MQGSGCPLGYIRGILGLCWGYIGSVEIQVETALAQAISPLTANIAGIGKGAIIAP